MDYILKQEQEKANEHTVRPTVTQPTSVHMEPDTVANSIKVGTTVTWERIHKMATLGGMTDTQFICAVLATDPTREELTTRVITVESADGNEIAKAIKKEVCTGGLTTAIDVVNLLFCYDSAVVAGLPLKGAGAIVKELAGSMSDRERRALYAKYVELAESHPSDLCSDPTLSPGAFELDMEDRSLANEENLLSMIHNLYQSAIYEGLRPVQPVEQEVTIHVIEGLFDSKDEAELSVSALARKYQAKVTLVADTRDSSRPNTFVYIPMTGDGMSMFEDYQSGDSTDIIDAEQRIIFVAGEAVSNAILSITDHRFKDDGLIAKKGGQKLRYSEELPSGETSGGAVASNFSSFIPFGIQLQFARVEGGAQDTVSNSGAAVLVDLAEQDAAHGGPSQGLYPAVPCAPSTVSSANILDTISETPTPEVYTNLFQRGASLMAQQRRVEAHHEQAEGSSAAQWQNYQPPMQVQQPPVNPDATRGDSNYVAIGGRIGDIPFDDLTATVASAIRALAHRPEDYHTLDSAFRLLFNGRPKEKISLSRAGSARDALNRYPDVLKAIDLKTLCRTAGSGNTIGAVFSKSFDICSRKVTVPDTFQLLMISARQIQKNCSLFSLEEDNGKTVVSANSV